MLRRVVIVGITPYLQGRVGGVASHMKNLERLTGPIAGVEQKFVYTEINSEWVAKAPFVLHRPLGMANAVAQLAALPSAPGTVVHLNTSLHARPIGAYLALMEVCRLRGWPVVLQVHGGRYRDLPTSGPARAMWRRAFESAGRMGIFPGPMWDELSELGYEDKMCRLYSLLPKTESPIAAEEGPARFFYLGRLVESKGVLDLLEAFGELHSEFPDITLMMCGSGELEGQIQEMLAEAPWGDAVSLPGFVPAEELGGLMEQGNVFVLPSRFPEGFPLAYLECGERGMCPLVTENSAIPIVFDEGVEFLALQPTVSDLLTQMRIVIEDPALRGQIGRAARKAIHANCVIEEAGKLYKSAFEEALAQTA